MPLSIPVGKGKLLLHLLRPGLLVQHLSKQPIEFDKRHVVQQVPDTITALIGNPIECSWSEATQCLFGFAACILKLPEPASNGWLIARQWLNDEKRYICFC